MEMSLDSGFSPRDRLDFDLAVVEFGEAFEREQERTEMRTVPKSTSKIHKAPFPKWSARDLAVQFLSVPEDDLDAQAKAADQAVDDLAADILLGKADWLYTAGEHRP